MIPAEYSIKNFSVYVKLPKANIVNENKRDDHVQADQLMDNNFDPENTFTDDANTSTNNKENLHPTNRMVDLNVSKTSKPFQLSGRTSSNQNTLFFHKSRT